MNDQLVTIVKKPKISVNKLAEYLEANASRRKTIIKDAKYPTQFKTTRYSDARSAITEFLKNGYEPEYISDIISQLRHKEAKSDYEKQDIRLSIQVLKLFLESDLTGISSFNFLPPGRSKLLKIAGVSISVNPDLIVEKQTPKQNLIGAIKLHIVKSNRLTVEGQNVVCVLLNTYIQTFLLDEDVEISRKLCISFDLFRQSLISGPLAFKARMLKVEDACEEIAARWDTL